MSLFKKNKPPRVKIKHGSAYLAAQEDEPLNGGSAAETQDTSSIEDTETQIESTPTEPILDEIETVIDQISETTASPLEDANLDLDEDLTLSEGDIVQPVIKDAFLSDSSKSFDPPSFSTQVPVGRPNIDVTPPEPVFEESRADRANVYQDQAADPVIQDPKLVPSRVELGSLRMDVAKISADITNGEELYRRAQRRVEGLMGFVERAEVDFSLLNRLEPENRRLKARNRTLNGELSDKESRLAISIADLEDHRNRLHDKTSQYEAVRSKLAATTKTLQGYETELKQRKTEIDSLTVEVERQKTAYEVEQRENKILQEKLASLAENLENRQGAYLTASKMVESLKVDCNDFREQSESLRAEVQDLRLNLDASQKKNNAMKGEMVTLHEDIQNFKTQYEFNILTREDRITDLETELSEVRKELGLTELSARKALDDLGDLRRVRSAQDVERDRLETMLQTVTDDLENTSKDEKRRSERKIASLEAHIISIEKQLSLKEEIVANTHKRFEDLKALNLSQEMERNRLDDVIKAQQRELESDDSAAEIRELKLKIKEYKEQIDLKDEIVQSAAHDVTALRKDRADQERERDRLQKQIDAQTYQLEESHSALLRSKQEASQLDQRYKDVAAALSVKQTREQSNIPAVTPDIQPAPTQPDTDLEWGPESLIPDADAILTEAEDPKFSNEPDFATQQVSVENSGTDNTDDDDLNATLNDMLDELTDADVADRITDFKLGLRKDIV